MLVLSSGLLRRAESVEEALFRVISSRKSPLSLCLAAGVGAMGVGEAGATAVSLHPDSRLGACLLRQCPARCVGKSSCGPSDLQLRSSPSFIWKNPVAGVLGPCF